MPEIHVRESIVIDRKVSDIYQFWRNLANLPRFIDHLDSVEDLGKGHNRWSIKTLVGELSWESEIVEDKEDEVIRWRSVPGARVINSGFLKLKPESDATEAVVEIHYIPPKEHDSFLEDKVLEAIADVQLKDDLRNLKRIMESETF
jgi:uncharacterized membrane protein